MITSSGGPVIWSYPQAEWQAKEHLEYSEVTVPETLSFSQARLVIRVIAVKNCPRKLHMGHIETTKERRGAGETTVTDQTSDVVSCIHVRTLSCY